MREARRFGAVVKSEFFKGAAGSPVKRLVQLSGEKNSGLDQEVEVEVVKRD